MADPATESARLRPRKSLTFGSQDDPFGLLARSFDEHGNAGDFDVAPGISGLIVASQGEASGSPIYGVRGVAALHVWL